MLIQMSSSQLLTILSLLMKSTSCNLMMALLKASAAAPPHTHELDGLAKDCQVHAQRILLAET